MRFLTSVMSFGPLSSRTWWMIFGPWKWILGPQKWFFGSKKWVSDLRKLISSLVFTTRFLIWRHLAGKFSFSLRPVSRPMREPRARVNPISKYLKLSEKKYSQPSHTDSMPFLWTWPTIVYLFSSRKRKSSNHTNFTSKTAISHHKFTRVKLHLPFSDWFCWSLLARYKSSNRR